MTPTIIVISLLAICLIVVVAVIARRPRSLSGSAPPSTPSRRAERRLIDPVESETAIESTFAGSQNSLTSDEALRLPHEGLAQQAQETNAYSDQSGSQMQSEVVVSNGNPFHEKSVAHLAEPIEKEAPAQNPTPEESPPTRAHEVTWQIGAAEAPLFAERETARDGSPTNDQDATRLSPPIINDVDPTCATTVSATDTSALIGTSDELLGVAGMNAKVVPAADELQCGAILDEIGSHSTVSDTDSFLQSADYAEPHDPSEESHAAQVSAVSYQIAEFQSTIVADPETAPGEAATTEASDAEMHENVPSAPHTPRPTIDSTSETVKPCTAPARSSHAQTFTAPDPLQDSKTPQIESAAKEVNARPRGLETTPRPKGSVGTEPAPVETSPVDLTDSDESDESQSTGTGVPTELEPPAGSTDALMHEGPRTARQYRARIGGGPTQSRERRIRSATKPQERPFVLTVRVLFERGGACRTSFIPERGDDMAEVVEVSGELGSYRFEALQDDCYGDVRPEGVGLALRSGIELQEKGTRRSRWALSGREIFVLAPSSKLRGFLSVPRLVISEEEQLVLCTQDRSADVQKVLHDIGCDKCTKLDCAMGVPDGWVLWRGATPKRSLPVSGTILDVLCPAPDIDIVLEGGIRLQHSEWLAGFPPHIRVRGDLLAPVLIDGSGAESRSDGIFIGRNAHSPGQHIVSCAGVSRTYSIVEPGEVWEPWTAYGFPTTENSHGSGICGAAILKANGVTSEETLWVPAANPVLLGANPGEIFFCQHRTDLRTAHWPISVPFSAVWALPCNPLHVDKRSNQVLLIGAPKPPALLPRCAAERRRFSAWASAILNCGRKGLPVRPTSVELDELWRSYRRRAREIWRASR